MNGDENRLRWYERLGAWITDLIERLGLKNAANLFIAVSLGIIANGTIDFWTENEKQKEFASWGVVIFMLASMVVFLKRWLFNAE